MNKRESSAHSRIKLFADTVARPLNGEWHLMNRQAKGFGENSLAFPSLADIYRGYDVSFGAYGCDEHGTFIQVFANLPNIFGECSGNKSDSR